VATSQTTRWSEFVTHSRSTGEPSPPESRATYTIEVIIDDARGFQVDAWLFEALHSDLEILEGQRSALVRVIRITQHTLCGACAAPLRVVFERASFAGMQATSPVPCPRCGAANDGMALGALAPPRVEVAPLAPPE
jgi:hypothetical protein